MWVPKMSSDLLARDDAYRELSFPTARTTFAHLVRPRVGSCVYAPNDVPAHRQERVDTLHSFNPFILFTGPDEVFGTHTTRTQVSPMCRSVPPSRRSGAPALESKINKSADPSQLLRLLKRCLLYTSPSPRD